MDKRKRKKAIRKYRRGEKLTHREYVFVSRVARSVFNQMSINYNKLIERLMYGCPSSIKPKGVLG